MFKIFLTCLMGVLLPAMALGQEEEEKESLLRDNLLDALSYELGGAARKIVDKYPVSNPTFRQDYFTEVKKNLTREVVNEAVGKAKQRIARLKASPRPVLDLYLTKEEQKHLDTLNATPIARAAQKATGHQLLWLTYEDQPQLEENLSDAERQRLEQFQRTPFGRKLAQLAPQAMQDIQNKAEEEALKAAQKRLTSILSEAPVFAREAIATLNNPQIPSFLSMPTTPQTEQSYKKDAE